MRELRGAAVLLHIEAEQRVAVVEQAVAVRVAEDRRVRHAVAVVGRRRVVQHGGRREGDRGIDGVGAVGGERDNLKVAEGRDLIGGRSPIERARLVLGITDARAIRVREDVVVREDVHVPQRISHARADRAGGDRRMPDREAHRGRALALRGIAEGHEHARHTLGYGNPVEHERQTGNARPVQEEDHARPSVRLNRDRRPDDTRDLEQRIGVTALRCNGQAEIRNEASDW